MLKKFLGFLLLFIPLEGGYKPADPFVLAVTESEPHLSISETVSPLTGDFYLARDDLVVAGAEPLSIPSLYVSGDGKTPYKGKVGWEILPHHQLILCVKKKQVIITEKNGSRLPFDHTLDQEYHLNLKKQGPGITNSAKGTLSARTHLRNAYVQEKTGTRMTYHASDGTIRKYRFRREIVENVDDVYRIYFLTLELLPNGNQIIYEYDSKDRPSLIKTTSPDGQKTYAWARFIYEGKPHEKPNFAIEASDGQRIHYAFKEDTYVVHDKIYGGKDHVEIYLLDRITRNFGPPEFFSYIPGHHDEGPRMSEAALPHRHFIAPTYYTTNDNLKKSDCRRNRVKTLSSPVGTSDQPVITHRFFYEKNKRKDNSYKYPCKTDIFDVFDHQTTLLANPFCRPIETQWYQNQDGKQNLILSEKTLWGEQDLEIGCLRAKLFIDQQGQGSFAKIYQYDAFGNVVSEKLCGNLSGQGNPCQNLRISPPAPSTDFKVYIDDRPGQDLLIGNHSKNFSTDWDKYLHRVGVGLYQDISTDHFWRLTHCHHNAATFRIVENSFQQIDPEVPAETSETTYGYTSNHLMAWKKDPSGLITRFTYLGATDLLASRLSYEGDRLLTREFFEYNSDHILVRSIEDNGTSADPHDLQGVTERRIKLITPKTTEPFLGLPEIIEERYVSSGQELLLRKTVLTYHPRGKVASKDCYDSQGNFRYRLSYEYDERGQLISESNPLGETKHYSYDEFGNKTTIRNGRLTTSHTYDFANRLIQTTIEGDDGIKQTAYHRYNLKNQKISTIDHLGHEIRFVYDAFDHLLETHLPTSDILTSSYDAFGRPFSTTDGNGDTTTRTFNARGQPTLVRHPDGNTETYLYNLDGTLKTVTDPHGTVIDHTYDVKGRLILKKIVSPSGELLSQESWDYGGFQLLSKTDTAGTLTTYEYDGAGRKIGEVCQDRRIEYHYDALGRITKTVMGPCVLVQEYDLLDRVIEERKEDLEGAILMKTLYAYDRAGNRSETSTGSSTEATLFDSFNRPIQHVNALGAITQILYPDHQKITIDPKGIRCIETYDMLGRVVAVEVKNLSNDLLHKETYAYDGAGNKTSQESTVFSPQSSPKTITTLWEYGPCNRLLKLTEAAGTKKQRTTRYAYTVKGLLEQIQKPDGTTITYLYDALNRLQELESSDLSCHYIFSYNALDQPTLIEDLTHQTRTFRTYDAFSRLIKETLASGFTLSSTYDALGRKTSLELPDYSSVVYTYDSAFLRKISRYSSQGQLQYSHQYTHFDQSGSLLQQELIHQLGSHFFEIDPLRRTTASTSSYFHSKILSYDTQGNLLSLEQEGQTYQFSYDDLSQITTDNHHYLYDSNYNRILKDGEKTTFDALNQDDLFSFDLNGNPLSDGKQFFSYDALNRLTAIITGTHYAQFTYDAFHRRISKKLFVQEKGEWVEHSTQYYLYDEDLDIGAADHNKRLSQLRILGIGPGAEIGASVAIELDAEVFAPIHDLHGNIVKLISKEGKVEEKYSYTAFGEEIISSSRNPWRYRSKRTETEFNLVDFGRRFYSPALGRWLTPDPQGFSDGMNLYAYVHNNSLLKLDLYGLEAIGYNLNFSISLSTCLQLAHLTALGATTLGKHLLPGLLGDLSGALRNHLAGLSYTRPSSQVITLGSRHAADGVALTAVNGILNSREDALTLGHKISQAHGAVFVKMIYNSSHGLLSDILEVLLDTIGIPSRPARLLASEWRSLLLGFAAQGISTGKIYHFAHSQGGTITKNALKLLTPNERSHIHAASFGSSSLFSEKLLGSVVHYAHSRDIVPMLSIHHYLKAKLLGSPTIRFLGRPFGSLRHSWEEPCYSNIIEERGRDFINEFFSP